MLACVAWGGAWAYCASSVHGTALKVGALLVLACPFVCEPDGRRWTFGLLKGAHRHPLVAFVRLAAALLALGMAAEALAVALAPALVLLESAGLYAQHHLAQKEVLALKVQLERQQLEAQLNRVAMDGCWLW